MKSSGVYALKSIFDDRVYIGSTKHLEKRKTQHFARLKNKVHKNRYLINFYSKYGEGSLKFEILEYCDVGKLLEREQYYLDQIPKKFRFNIVEEVSKPPSTKGMIYTEEWRNNISKALKGYKHGKQHRQKRREYMLSDKNPMRNPESRKAVSDGQKFFTNDECKRIWQLNQSKKYTPKDLSEIMAFPLGIINTALKYAKKYFYPGEKIYRVGGNAHKKTFSDKEAVNLLIEYNTTFFNIRELVEKYGSSNPVIDRTLRRARELRPDLKIDPEIVKKKSRRFYDIEGNYIWKKKQKQYLSKEEISERISRGMRHFSDDRCLEIGKEYETGLLSQDKLARKYNINRSCIRTAIKVYKKKKEGEIK